MTDKQYYLLVGKTADILCNCISKECIDKGIDKQITEQ